MENRNYFIKGIDQDIAKDKLPKDSYFDALNMRIITDTGGTSGDAQNIKGNVEKISFKFISGIYSVTASSAFISTTTSDITVTINGITSTYTGILNTFTTIADYINNDPAFQAIFVRAYTNEGSIFNDIPTLYITLSSGQILTFAIVSSTETFNINIYAPNTNSVQIVGWVAMREDIILFTTSNSSPNPTNTLSQIWKLTYDKTTLNTNIELLYNNYLNLSLEYPIANPGMIEARYETAILQNIYWTDNNSEPKVVNVADPNLYAVDPRLLNLATITSPFIPIPTKVNQSGGGLKTGVHQVAYRLSKNSGGETNWFLPSYPINIVQSDEEIDPIATFEFNTTYELINRGYEGGGADLIPSLPTNKSINYKISGIDTNYTRIEIAHIYKKSFIAEYNINIVANEPVVTDTLSFTLSGLENDIVPVTFEEFNGFNEIFKKVGTITAKNNYLFLGNIQTTNKELNWDSRAYRFNASGISDVLDDLGNSTNIDSSNWILADNHAAINPNDDPTSTANYLYQSDGTTLGGEGPNIKYKFHTENVIIDNSPNLGGGLNGTPPNGPYRDVSKFNKVYGLNSSSPIDQKYNSLSTFLSYHSPYLSGFLKGYTRDETYRFAIVFYDLGHNPLFAKWIGDIRMPHMWMPNGTNAYDRTLVYPLTNDTASYAASKVLVGYSLGIEFTVSNLDSIADQVSGYSIIRCKRPSEDRTIVGQGLFQPAFANSFSGNTYLPSNDYIFDNNPVSTAIASLYSPEFLFPNPQSNYVFSSNDLLDIIGIYMYDYTDEVKEKGAGTHNPSGVGNAIYTKNYTHHTTGPNSILDSTAGNLTPYTLTASVIRNPWFKDGYGPFTLGLTTDIKNHSSNGSGGGWTGGGRSGSKCLVLEGDFSAFGDSSFGGDEYPTADTVQGTLKMYVANYKRNLKTGHLSTQYTGNTFAQRSKSEYISTNNYQPIRASSSQYINKVYGGDTYICIFDNWQQFYDVPTGTSGSIIRYFPVETTLNVEMRQPQSSRVRIPNKYVPDNTAPETYEEFLYNPIFSNENDVRIFFSKPDPYIPETRFDCRIYNSANPKINGELIDSWRQFKPEDYIELDSKFGPINFLISHRNRLFYFQNTGLGIYQTNEKSLIQDSDGGELILGTGGIKQRFDYMSEKIGCKHKFSVSQSHDAISFFDISNRRAFMIKEGLQEVQGLNGYFQKNLIGDIFISDNPYLSKGITSTYDYRYNEFIMTFFDNYINDMDEKVNKAFTLGFCDPTNKFTSFYSFTPKTYINDKYNFFTPSFEENIEKLYIHNVGEYGNFYNKVYPSNITFIANENPEVEKVFDNFIINGKTYLNEVNIPVVGFDTFQVYNDYQDTGLRNFSDKARFIKRKWNAAIGGDKNNTRFTERIKSNYALSKFEILNQNNYYIVLEDVITKFRVNPTMV